MTSDEAFKKAARLAELALAYADECDGARYLLLRARALGEKSIAVPLSKGYDRDDFEEAEAWLKEIGALSRDGGATAFGWAVLGLCELLDECEEDGA
jgi:hypothetical protein